MISTISSGVEHRLHTAGVVGSNPTSCTLRTAELGRFFCAPLQGNSEAQYNLGAMFENGDGLEQDIEKANEWYKNGKSFQKWLLDMVFNATYES